MPSSGHKLSLPFLVTTDGHCDSSSSGQYSAGGGGDGGGCHDRSAVQGQASKEGVYEDADANNV